jgi:hypothetical protein
MKISGLLRAFCRQAAAARARNGRVTPASGPGLAGVPSNFGLARRAHPDGLARAAVTTSATRPHRVEAAAGEGN